jgi:hypothetical protein
MIKERNLIRRETENIYGKDTRRQRKLVKYLRLEAQRQKQKEMEKKEGEKLQEIPPGLENFPPGTVISYICSPASLDLITSSVSCLMPPAYTDHLPPGERAHTTLSSPNVAMDNKPPSDHMDIGHQTTQ